MLGLYVVLGESNYVLTAKTPRAQDLPLPILSPLEPHELRISTLELGNEPRLGQCEWNRTERWMRVSLQHA